MFLNTGPPGEGILNAFFPVSGNGISLPIEGDALLNFAGYDFFLGSGMTACFILYIKDTKPKRDVVWYEHRKVSVSNVGFQFPLYYYYYFTIERKKNLWETGVKMSISVISYLTY